MYPIGHAQICSLEDTFSHKGTFPGARELSSRNLANLADLSELCLWLKKFMVMACFGGDQPFLLLQL